MTTTYSPFATDKDRVRFYVGDTDMTAAVLTDEEITGLITENGGSWQAATIAGLEFLITKIAATPQFSSGWLSLTRAGDVQALQKRVTVLRRNWGITAVYGETVNTYRPDSRQNAEPDYTDLQSGGYDDYPDNRSIVPGF